jgi:hypothetical protein
MIPIPVDVPAREARCPPEELPEIAINEVSIP